MSLRFLPMIAVLVCFARPATAQSVGPPDLPHQPPAQETAPGPHQQSVSWKGLIPNIASDQRRIWSFPFHIVQRKEWLPVIGAVATTSALIALDEVDTPPLRRTTDFRSFNTVVSSRNTALFTAAVPASLLAAGYIGRDSYSRNTALLAGEAVADSEMLAVVIKTLDRRKRPENFQPQGNFADSWFETKSSLGRGSFPSGHTIAAFSIATVIARRYGKHRWVPYLAYAAAGTVAFSRLTASAHFPSDVFAGGVLGYSISRFIVLRH